MEMIQETDFEALAQQLMAAELADWRAALATALLPVAALVFWTFAMMLWMLATRLPPLLKAGKLPQEVVDNPRDAMSRLPAAALRSGANYNHLHEQPVLFYALATSLALIAPTSAVGLGLAWAYVGLRVLHSLVQATANILKLRFLLFLLASFALIGLGVVTLMELLAAQG